MSKSLVIVAIPAEDDIVWKISSEKVPHLTLMYLGEADGDNNMQRMADFVEHALKVNNHGPFYLEVDHRDELGDQKADVLFFEGGWDTKWIKSLRGQLLKQSDIRAAYEAQEQFPEWVPHLTLGYPDAPAKPIPDDRRLYSVEFDRIAVWDGDYEGPEFRLKWDRDQLMESHGSVYDSPVMAMSSVNQARIALGLSPHGESPEALLAHYGVKGMRWGVRKKETRKSMWDPEGHDLEVDVAKSLILPIFPPFAIFAVPANVRLVRGGFRGTTAKIADVKDKNFEKNVESAKNFEKIHDAAKPKIKKSVDEINKKYPVDLTKDAAKKQAYDAEVTKAMQDAYRESAKGFGNTTRTRRLDVKFENDGRDFRIVTKEGAPKKERVVSRVQHADDDDETVTFTGKIKRHTTGHIIGFEFDTDGEVEHAFMIIDEEDTLEHFGVKGMKWGVRKEDTLSNVGKIGKGLGKAAIEVGKIAGDVQFENMSEDGRARAAIQDKAGVAFRRTDLPAIKKKPEYTEAAKLRNRLRHPRDPITKQYRKEVKEAYIKRLEDAANSMENFSGTRQYTIRERGWELPAAGGALPTSKYFWDVSTRKVQHAADNFDGTSTLELIMDEDGFITDIKMVAIEEAVKHGLSDIGATFLEHYGVKGMRWGVRKSEPTAVAPTATSVVPHGARRKTKVKAEGGENHPASEDAIKVAEARAKLTKSGTAALSNKELRDVADRMRLEEQVTQMTRNKGRKFITDLATNQGKQAANQAVRSEIDNRIFGRGRQQN